MAGKSGSIKLSVTSGSSGAVGGYIDWTSTLLDANSNMYSLDIVLRVHTDGYGDRNCWYHFYKDGSTIKDSSVSISGSGYHEIYYNTFTVYANDDGRYSGSIGALFGYNSSGSGKQEASGSVSNLKIGDENYKVYYYTNDGSGALFKSFTGNKSGTTHTVIHDVPTHSGAKSRSETFKITGNANGGDSDKSITATKNIAITRTFLGWSTNSGASSPTYTGGNQFSITRTTTLYAIWKTTESVSSYSNNTLANLGTPTRSPVGALYDITLNGNNDKEPTILDAGLYTTYLFLGWNTSAGASSALPSSTAYTSATTVYAIWKETTIDNRILELPTPTKDPNVITTYTVTFDANGGTVNPESMDANKAIRYRFIGWSTVDGESANIVSNPYTPDGSPTTLYAIWQDEEGTDELQLPIPVLTDFRFLGWAININSSTYVDMNYVPTQNITLYAKYSPIYTAEIYVWHNGKWNRVIPHLYYENVFNESVSAT